MMDTGIFIIIISTVVIGVIFLFIFIANVRYHIDKTKSEEKPKKTETVQEVKSMGVKYSNDNYLKNALSQKDISDNKTEIKDIKDLEVVDDEEKVYLDEENEFYGDTMADNMDRESKYQILNGDDIVKDENFAIEYKKLSPKMKTIIISNLLNPRDDV